VLIWFKCCTICWYICGQTALRAFLAAVSKSISTSWGVRKRLFCSKVPLSMVNSLVHLEWNCDFYILITFVFISLCW
jgi:hypothetical protein